MVVDFRAEDGASKARSPHTVLALIDTKFAANAFTIEKFISPTNLYPKKSFLAIRPVRGEKRWEV